MIVLVITKIKFINYIILDNLKYMLLYYIQMAKLKYIKILHNIIY